MPAFFTPTRKRFVLPKSTPGKMHGAIADCASHKEYLAENLALVSGTRLTKPEYLQTLRQLTGPRTRPRVRSTWRVRSG